MTQMGFVQIAVRHPEKTISEVLPVMIICNDDVVFNLRNQRLEKTHNTRVQNDPHDKLGSPFSSCRKLENIEPNLKNFQ